MVTLYPSATRKPLCLVTITILLFILLSLVYFSNRRRSELEFWPGQLTGFIGDDDLHRKKEATTSEEYEEDVHVQTITKTEYVTRTREHTMTLATPTSTRIYKAEPVSGTPEIKEWAFDTERDSKNYGLSAEQCSVAFEGLFDEVDRAVEYTKKRGKNISSTDLDLGWAKSGLIRAMIYNHQVN